MTEPMSDERLEEIRESIKNPVGPNRMDVDLWVAEQLLTEVERLRAERNQAKCLSDEETKSLLEWARQVHAGMSRFLEAAAQIEERAKVAKAAALSLGKLMTTDGLEVAPFSREVPPPRSATITDRTTDPDGTVRVKCVVDEETATLIAGGLFKAPVEMIPAVRVKCVDSLWPAVVCSPRQTSELEAEFQAIVEEVNSKRARVLTPEELAALADQPIDVPAERFAVFDTPIPPFPPGFDPDSPVSEPTLGFDPLVAPLAFRRSLEVDQMVSDAETACRELALRPMTREEIAEAIASRQAQLDAGCDLPPTEQGVQIGHLWLSRLSAEMSVLLAKLDWLRAGIRPPSGEIARLIECLFRPEKREGWYP